MKTPENNLPLARGLSFQQKTFVNGMVSHGNRRIAYQAAYPKAAANTARANAYKLMQDDHIINAIEEAKLQQQNACIANPKEMRKAARILKMRDLLDGIINGTITTQQVVTDPNGKVRRIKNTIDINALVAAIKNYDKLEHFLDTPNYVD